MDAALRRRLFGIDPRETTFERRGFPARDADSVAQLERAGASFVAGYHAALASPDEPDLGRALDRVEPAWRGFAYEGAGMALALLDRVTPWSRRRLERFLAGAGEAHVYMVTIGAGWAWARLGRRLAPVERERRRLDPLLGWLALDGCGFHEGYFHKERTVTRASRMHGVAGFGARAFDAGVGRSLWFVCGADPERIAETIGGFAADRRADLWAGAGLACTYAGGVSGEGIARLVALSGAHRPALAQGAAFAAKARERAGNPAPHVETAVVRICATSPELAAKLCDTELASATSVEGGGDVPAFERWRIGIRRAFARAFAAGST